MQITEAILESNKDIYSKNQDWKSGQKLFAWKLKLELLYAVLWDYYSNSLNKTLQQKSGLEIGSKKEMAC